MKKVQKILCTIGGVLHIVNGVSIAMAALYLFVAAVLFFVTGTFYGAQIVEQFGEAVDVSIAFSIVAIIYIWMGLLFVALAVLSFVASKLTFRSAESNNQKRLITALVFAVILDVKVAIAGAVFGLIASGKENKKQINEESAVADEVVK